MAITEWTYDHVPTEPYSLLHTFHQLLNEGQIPTTVASISDIEQSAAEALSISGRYMRIVNRDELALLLAHLIKKPLSIKGVSFFETSTVTVDPQVKNSTLSFTTEIRGVKLPGILGISSLTLNGCMENGAPGQLAVVKKGFTMTTENTSPFGRAALGVASGIIQTDIMHELNNFHTITRDALTESLPGYGYFGKIYEVLLGVYDDRAGFAISGSYA